MRDPVTMIAWPVWANAGDAASAVSEAVAARNTLGRVPIFISYPILKLILPPGAPHIRPRAFQYGLRAGNPRWRAARLSGPHHAARHAREQTGRERITQWARLWVKLWSGGKRSATTGSPRAGV